MSLVYIRNRSGPRVNSVCVRLSVNYFHTLLPVNQITFRPFKRGACNVSGPALSKILWFNISKPWL